MLLIVVSHRLLIQGDPIRTFLSKIVKVGWKRSANAMLHLPVIYFVDTIDRMRAEP